jgi:hypothetical protein
LLIWRQWFEVMGDPGDRNERFILHMQWSYKALHTIATTTSNTLWFRKLTEPKSMEGVEMTWLFIEWKYLSQKCTGSQYSSFSSPLRSKLLHPITYFKATSRGPPFLKHIPSLLWKPCFFRFFALLSLLRPFMLPWRTRRPQVVSSDDAANQKNVHLWYRITQSQSNPLTTWDHLVHSQHQHSHRNP